MKTGYEERYEALKNMCEKTLEGVIPDCVPPKLRESMRYSLLGGGKRLRPVLYLAVLGSYGRAPSETDLKTAAAIECVHTYSLIHDDLPAMDDDDYRRGRPSNHKMFGEATAVLAGDALHCLAFQLLADCACVDGHYARIMKLMADCAGACGMIGGQALEFETDLASADAETFGRIDALKTGKLMEAAILGGCIAACRDDEYEIWKDYAVTLGRAFQLRDDLHDADTGERSLASALGRSAEAELESLIRKADEKLKQTGGNSEFLRELTKAVLSRTSDNL